MSYYKRVLLLVGFATFFSVAADAQIDKPCAEAASLWVPSGTSREKIVAKWKTSIGYEIIAGGHGDIAASIESALQFLAQESGLKIASDTGSAVDLMIGVVPDISVFASPDARKRIESYFQDLFLKKGLPGRFEIDPTGWEASARSVTPKCLGVNYVLDGAVERAFLVVQEGETSLCIHVGLGELFGLVRIRNYYLDHGRNVPTDLIALALRTLYDERIKAGINRMEADKRVGEICKL
jgi:hypothetical protein